MITKRLFKENVYLKECEAQVLEIRQVKGSQALILDETVFFPEGGGQTCDLGEIAPLGSKDGSAFKVADVYEFEDEILHIMVPGTDFNVGDRVSLKIDWARRFDNMQRHCGEHILTGIFYREYGLTNRGFHMGDEYMTIDLAIEEDATVNTVDWEMCKNAELLTNEVIYENMPMITRHFDTYDEAKNEPMRKKLAVEKDITLVGIGKTEYDWGCVACCGTHPSFTSQVGLVKIFKVESNKGMFRVYFEAGRRAFIKYQEEMDLLLAMGKRLSAGTQDMMDKYEAQVEKNKEKGLQLNLLKKEVFKREADSLKKALSGGEGLDDAGFLRRDYSILTLDDLTSLGREVGPVVKKVAFLVSVPAMTVLLISDGKTDCGKLVRENAGIYNGKGGGNATQARAIFNKEEYIDVFIDLIEKHLR